MVCDLIWSQQVLFFHLDDLLSNQTTPAAVKQLYNHTTLVALLPSERVSPLLAVWPDKFEVKSINVRGSQSLLTSFAMFSCLSSAADLSGMIFGLHITCIIRKHNVLRARLFWLGVNCSLRQV